MKTMKSFCKTIATLGPIGYLPAPGTCASLFTLFFIYVLHMLHISWTAYSAIMLAIALIGLNVIKVSQDHFKHHDPSEIVVDELVGCLITFWNIPFSWHTALIGFILFRFFDISKIFGIKWLEKQGKVAGVMLDDIGAGLLSNFILHGLLWIWAIA